jgi:hypothetical protein
VAFCGAAWVAGHIIEVAIVSAVCGALAVAAVVGLMRWQDRRQAAIGPLMVTRADVIAAGVPGAEPARIRRPSADFGGQIGTPVPDSVPRSIPLVHLAPHGAAWTAQVDQGADHPAIAPATVITGGTHLWIVGDLDAEQAAARIIRQALPGTAGDAITEGKEPS